MSQFHISPKDIADKRSSLAADLALEKERRATLLTETSAGSPNDEDYLNFLRENVFFPLSDEVEYLIWKRLDEQMDAAMDEAGDCL